MATLRIRRPDDWHVHLRDEALLSAVLPATAEVFARALVMPNLEPPVVTVADASGYRRRIMTLLPEGSGFQPLMTCYLTEAMSVDDLRAGFLDKAFMAAKLYPAGATTNSDAGVRDVTKIYPVLDVMQGLDMPLAIHGEVVDDATDVFDREAVFIERTLAPLVRRFPELRIILEHVTTIDGIDFIAACGPRIAGTITPHHLTINRNAMFKGGFRPHYYCLPVAKREHHRRALRRAATSGDPKYFIGTDSAPHTVQAKESASGCAGIYNAPTALACYAQVFDEEDALDRLEAFTSINGPRFYRVAENTDEIVLERCAPPERAADLETDLGPVRVFTPAGGLRWRVAAPR